jgi:CheY-like chemotaxis protein
MGHWLPDTTATDPKLTPFSAIDRLIPEEVIPQSAEGLDKNSGEKPILIVDDDPTILMLVSSMVRHLGYRPKTALNGMDALFHLGRSGFKLIITDYEMPLMNGLDLARQIKMKLMDTLVIIMTGNQDDDLVSDIEASGVVAGLLLKPFNLNTLRETIETATRQGQIRWVS